MKLIILLVALMLASAACNKEGGHDAALVDEVNYVDTSTGGTTTVDTTNEAFTDEFMELVNNHRQGLGLYPLTNDVGMSAIAQKHSANMAAKITAFGHTGFSQRCSEAKDAIGGGNQCGENVAMGQKSPQAVFTSWMNSPGHRANIEGSRYTHSGFGFAKSASGSWYWTHIFLEEN